LIRKPLNDCYTESNNLTGSIPSEVGTMLSLRTFLVGELSVMMIILVLLFVDGYVSLIYQLPSPGDNKLTGPIPSEVGRLTEMKLFNISHNMLSNGIPTEIVLMNVVLELDLSEYLITINSLYSIYTMIASYLTQYL